jgi:hypothetical protein
MLKCLEGKVKWWKIVHERFHILESEDNCHEEMPAFMVKMTWAKSNHSIMICQARSPGIMKSCQIMKCLMYPASLLIVI